MANIVEADILRPVITNKGLAAANQAATLGKSVRISHIGVSAVGGVANPEMTSLPGESYRESIADGRVISDKQVNVSALLKDTAPSVDIRGLAFYLDDGTLFAAHLTKEPILVHTQGSTLLIGMDFVMDNIPSNSVVVESTGANLVMGDWVPVDRTVNGLKLTSNIVLTAAHVKAVPEGRKVNGKVLTSDITLGAADVKARPDNWMPTAADVKAVPDARTVNGKRLNANIALSASDVGAHPSTWTPDVSGLVPTTRRVNNKPLSADVNLTASDVGAATASHTHDYVPTSRTVNGKPLNANIALNASDVSAVPTSRKVNGKTLSADVTLTAADVKAVDTSEVATSGSDWNGIINKIPRVDSVGVIDLGRYIDLRGTNRNVDFDWRIDGGNLDYNGLDFYNATGVRTFSLSGSTGDAEALRDLISRRSLRVDSTANPIVELHAVGKYASALWVEATDGSTILSRTNGASVENFRLASWDAAGNLINTGSVASVSGRFVAQGASPHIELWNTATAMAYMTWVGGDGALRFSVSNGVGAPAADQLTLDRAGNLIAVGDLKAGNGAAVLAGNGNTWGSIFGAHENVTNWASATFQGKMTGVHDIGSYICAVLTQNVGTVATHGDVAGSYLACSSSGGLTSFVPDGTWRCMGAAFTGTQHGYDRTTLWRRIA